ncbi:hypothetical protein [Hyphomicrobium sp.]|uniref:hypothetical protein n=1 Tax=Hyphomicrobium sp. TaxID=82 RepID=UPI001DD01AEA|nr:hypothetical protein [Hyphomicrobium sp.]MBY0561501.1 hypothetical protein [Hyphomicrobium sp.]
MASYSQAISWIAENDEDAETDPEVIASLISVMMVADLWDKEPETVARDVLKKRADNADYASMVSRT